MGSASPIAYVPWLLGGCLAAFLLAAVVACREYSQSRRVPYYYLREQARLRCARAVLVALLRRSTGKCS